MTSRVTPKQCSLREAVGQREVCPGGRCAFWEDGGAVIEAGCEIERLAPPIARNRELARHLLELRLALEAARSESERSDARRRFAVLLNLNRE
jgi:hypothetical protein